MDTLNLFSVQDFFVVMCRLKDITGTLNNQIISLFSFTLTKNIQSKQALKNILKRKGKYFSKDSLLESSSSSVASKKCL